MRIASILQECYLKCLKRFIKEYINYNEILWEVEKGAQSNLKEKQEVLKVVVQNVLQL